MHETSVVQENSFGLSKRDIAYCIIIGIAGGFLGGLLGVGGGIIMVPLLLGLMKVTQHQANATSLAVIVFTAIAAAFTYGMQGNLDYILAVEVMIGSVIGARIGASWMHRLSALTLSRAFAIFTILVAIRFFIPIPITALVHYNGGDPVSIILSILVGLLAGILAGLFGVGGGIIMVPALLLIFGLNQHLAQGISLLVIVPTAIVGTYTNYRNGSVVTRYLLPIAAASIIAAIVASNVAANLDATFLRYAFAVLLIFNAYRSLTRKPKK